MNWLREFVALPEDAERTGELLTLLGFEVEQITHTGISLPGVVIGHVLQVEKHANADRLRVCQVDIGEKEPVQIVCGAPNVAAGQKVAVATVGTELPLKLPDGKNIVIKASSIRGVTSNGMICAEDELGIGTDHNGIMILDSKLVPGSRFDVRFENERDSIIEISITPNRPDVTNHLGAARELSAKLSRPLTLPEYNTGKTAAKSSDFSVEIASPADCSRYMGILIRNVKIGPSPDWLKKRLDAAGVRSINNVVDATNYVMMAVGQPLHAFDFDRLNGGKIVVQSFDHDVLFTTLDHTERSVPAGSLFICDAAGPVALAGVMGGLTSEVTDSTTSILLESAYFNPVTIRRASRLLSLRSDASYRFERGIDPENTANAGWLCARLIADLAGGQLVEPAVDVVADVFKPLTVTTRVSRTNQILGTDFTLDYCAGILNRLGLKTTTDGKDVMTSVIPGFRPDLDREIDMIEEVARVHDYNEIEAPKQVGFKKPDPIPEEIRFIQILKDALVRAGLREIYTNSLHPDLPLEGLDEENAVRPLNPITRDQSILRTSLLPGMLKIAAFNENRGAAGMALFEVGRVFRKDQKGRFVEGIHENIQVGVLLAGQATAASWRGPARNWDVFDLKMFVETLSKQLELGGGVMLQEKGPQELDILIKGKKAGYARTISGKSLKSYGITMPVFQAELDAEALCGIWLSRKAKKFAPLAKYPGIEYDVAFVMDNAVPAKAIQDIVVKKGGALVQQVGVFDVFAGAALGDGRKSLAFRINFLDVTKTLTLNDIQPIIDEIVKEAGAKTGAVLRS